MIEKTKAKPRQISHFDSVGYSSFRGAFAKPSQSKPPRSTFSESVRYAIFAHSEATAGKSRAVMRLRSIPRPILRKGRNLSSTKWDRLGHSPYYHPRFGAPKQRREEELRIRTLASPFYNDLIMHLIFMLSGAAKQIGSFGGLERGGAYSQVWQAA